MTNPVDPFIVRLPWPKPPLSLNDRMHWRPKYEATKRVQGEALICIRNTKPRLPRLVAAEVVLCWRVPDLRERDLDNVVATLKPVIDALVQAGVLPKDDWKHVRQASTRIDPPEPGKKVAVWLEVTPREAYA